MNRFCISHDNKILALDTHVVDSKIRRVFATEVPGLKRYEIARFYDKDAYNVFMDIAMCNESYWPKLTMEFIDSLSSEEVSFLCEQDVMQFCPYYFTEDSCQNCKQCIIKYLEAKNANHSST